MMDIFSITVGVVLVGAIGVAALVVIFKKRK